MISDLISSCVACVIGWSIIIGLCVAARYAYKAYKRKRSWRDL